MITREMKTKFQTRAYLYKVKVGISGQEEYELLHMTNKVANDNANYLEKEGGYISFGWKKTAPKIVNFEGVVSDFKIYTDLSFLEEKDLKGVLCLYNEYSSFTRNNCIKCDSFCRSCSLLSNKCTSCFDGLYLYNGACHETCPVYLYKVKE